jgi:hypothetical protein
MKTLKTLLAVAALLSPTLSTLHAQTIFNGGSLLISGNWTNGLPTTGNNGATASDYTTVFQVTNGGQPLALIPEHGTLGMLALGMTTIMVRCRRKGVENPFALSTKLLGPVLRNAPLFNLLACMKPFFLSFLVVVSFFFLLFLLFLLFVFFVAERRWRLPFSHEEGLFTRSTRR